VLSRNIEQTERAVNWLVERGFLREETTNAAGPVFRLDRARQADARAFLNAERAGSLSVNGE
jgi:hypothetical protein